jgi:hypothetical protein
VNDLRFIVSPYLTVASILTCRLESGVHYTIAIVLLVLWVLGLVSANTLGGLLHVLVVVAVVLLLLRVIQGKRL